MSLFRSRNFTLASVLGFLVGFAMFGAVTFLPQFQQLVQGARPPTAACSCCR